MSKFLDKLQRVSRVSSGPIGFHASAAQSNSSGMLLVAGLSGSLVKETRIAADASVDAALVLKEGVSVKAVKQMMEAVGGVPLGVLVKGMSADEMGEFVGLGCDFVVFDIKSPSAVLHNEEAGRVLATEPSLDMGLLRAVNSLDVDGVLIHVGGEQSFVSVEQLLVCRRFVELLEAPVMMALPSSVTGAELAGIWQAGVDGVVAPPSQSAESLADLQEMIGKLPRGSRGRRAKLDVRLPHLGGGGDGGEDEEADDDEDI